MNDAGNRGGICLTNPFAWPQVKRGTETLIRSFGGWLHRSGRSVEILAGGPTTGRYELDGVTVRLFRIHPATRIHRDLDEEVTFIPAMAWHVRRSAPRIVHSFLYQDASAARLSGRPYVVSYGGIALASSGVGHPLKRRLFRFASDGAREIVCPSHAAARHLHETYGYSAQVIPNAITTADFAATAERRDGLVLCTATPDDQRKRISVLVDAFRLAGRWRPQLQLVLAGRASDASRRELMDRLPADLRPRLRFTGDVEAQELRSLYASAAVTCLPSLHEAFGMVLIESLASGTPVVGADHGAIPEIVTEEVGSLFTPDDPEACAKAIVDVIDRGANEALDHACRARAAQFDWDVIGPRLLDLYERIAD